jgi:hypothetical protein
MATTVPQSIRDAFTKAKAGTQPLTYTDGEGYQWLALSPQTYGGGDQGASTVDGIYMGGGGPISGYRRADRPGSHPGTIGNEALFYGADGNYTHSSQNDAVGIMGNPLFGAALIAALATGGASLGALGGSGAAAGAGAAGAGAAGAGSAGLAGLGSVTAGAGGYGAGMGLGAGFGAGAGGLGLGSSFGAGALGLEAGMAGLGAAGAAGAGAAMGAGAEGLGYGSGFGSSLSGGMGTSVPGGAGYGSVGSSFAPEAISAGTYGASAGGLEGAMGGLGSAGSLGSAAAGAAGLGGGGGGGGNGAGGFNWGSLVGPAVSAIGGVAGANAAKDAASAQLQAAREAQAKLEPWYQAGGNALTRLQELLGIGGNKGAADYGSAAKDFGASDFQADPGYAFRKAEGEKALTRAASAGGGLGSGKYLKDAMSWNQGQASQEYDRSFNRFYTSRQNKLSPFQSLAGQGQTTAQTMGDLSTQAGNAAAAGKVGQANALTNAIGQGYSMYQNSQQSDQNNQLMNLLLRRGA